MPRKPKKVTAPPRRKKNMKGRKRGGASMPCPTCGSDSKVALTRRDGSTVLRNRLCRAARSHAFLTIEKVQAF